MLRPAANLRARRMAAFTLVELCVVVGIIAIVAAAALPEVKRINTASRANTIANDLRVFAGAFQTYAHQNGAYPAEAAAGVLPAGMEGLISRAAWTRVTPLGGYYNWDYNIVHNGVTYRAVIAISAVSGGSGINNGAGATVNRDAALLTAIDKLVDDGNLGTGNFIVPSGADPFYVIER